MDRTWNGDRMIDLMEMKLISCIFHKKRHLDVYRDKWGKFYVRNDGLITQRKLNAEETVRYLCNVLNNE